MNTAIRFTSFPLTCPPPSFIASIVDVFCNVEASICTSILVKGLTSNEVLAAAAPGLQQLGFEIESGSQKNDRIPRPVFFGENGGATLRYYTDAFHPGWKCALEVEAGRAWMGNAIYRDIVQALVMVDVEHLVLAVPLTYKYVSGGKQTKSTDYANAIDVASALYGHSRIRFPYGLTVLGY